MGRNRGGGRPAPTMRAPARPAPAPPARKPEQRNQPAHAPQHSTMPAPPASSSSGGFLATMAQGLAFGTGSAVAHRAIGAAAGAMTGGGSSEAVHDSQGGYEQPSYSQPQQQSQFSQGGQGACGIDQQNLMACLNANTGNAAACDFFFQSLQACQRQSAERSSF